MGHMANSIHIFFFPYLARGHIIPQLETARLFAERDNVQCTFITTPANAPFVRPAVESAASAGLSLRLLLIPFPANEVGLPSGIECTDSLPSNTDLETLTKLYTGISLLQKPFEDLVTEHRPDCIISDFFVYWPTDVAHSRSIPSFLFYVCSPYSKCVIEHIFNSGAHITESNTVGPLTGLPHPIQLTKPELPHILGMPTAFKAMRAAEEKACGVLFNCFRELMPQYVEHCRIAMPGDGSVYCVGPVQLHSSIPDPNWESASVIKSWLDSKPDESVIYVGFGSECCFSGDQLREIALGLARCDHSFIWVVRGGPKTEEWMPEEFEAAVRDGRGLLMTEWAPQVAILNHRATGGQVLHCGWNSTLEALCAGLPVVAWPLHTEQFINERLVVEVLKVGVRILIGAEVRCLEDKGIVKAEVIKEAVDRLMGGGDEEVRAIRMEARKYPEIVRSAMRKEGSSYVDISHVIELIRHHLRENK